MPWPLALAVASPAVGVLLYTWLHERPRLMRGVDVFVYVALPSLVGWQVLPHAWAARSVLPVAALALGLGAVTVVERVLHRFAAHKYAARTDDAAIVASLTGIGFHASLEGAVFALDTVAAGEARALATAILIDRVLMGLVIWWLVRPRHGPMLAALAVAVIPVATLIGFATAAELGASGAGPGAKLYQAFVAGTLLHVVFHQGRHDHDHGQLG